MKENAVKQSEKKLYIKYNSECIVAKSRKFQTVHENTSLFTFKTLVGGNTNKHIFGDFCGTNINISTNRNPYKRGMKHWLIKIHSDMYRLYFKTSFG